MDNTSSEPRIGDYRLLSKIGEGKSGVVHLATPVVTKPFAVPGQPVALKIYRPEILREPNQVERIENEARVGQEIAHPNVARIYEHEILRNKASKEIDQAFLVMEYVDGITLHAWLSMFHRISDRLLLRIFRQLVDGTHALHEKGVIHRDIKPTNILISSTFQAKITDFGVVKVKDTPPGGSTPEDKFLGTIRNASPELLFGEKFDQRADLYSLGTVLYALLHGIEIFAAENQFARLIELKRHQDPEFDTAFAGKPIRGRLADLAKKLLSRDPTKRPESAQVVQQEIAEIEKLMPTGEDEPEPLHGYIATALTGLGPDVREAIVFASHSIVAECKEHELYVYQPRLASDPVSHSDVSAEEVYRLDRGRVVAADVLFVLANQPSLGVGQEIEIASSYGKPTILIAREGVTVSRMTKGSYANLIGEITYSSPEDLHRKLRELLRTNIGRLRSLRAGLNFRAVTPVADRFSEARKAAGYSLAEAAMQSGISQTLLRAIENGQNDNFGIVIINKLCVLYGISVDELLKTEPVRAKPAGPDPNVRRLESVARRLSWPATDLLELRDEYSAELAASGADTGISEEEWEQRHAASQKQKLKEATQKKFEGF
jgi:serine/threonine protein kinase/transcriptional regulator with XRE-family HTH domain